MRYFGRARSWLNAKTGMIIISLADHDPSLYLGDVLQLLEGYYDDACKRKVRSQLYTADHVTHIKA